jgi:large-conductance mechanosensitive channel
MGGAYFFEWLEQGEIFGTVILFIMVAVVYFIIMFVMFKNDERIARDMNQKLRKPYIKEEED